MSEDCNDFQVFEKFTPSKTTRKYNITIKAYACVYEKYSTWGVFQGKYSTQLCLALYFSYTLAAVI